MRLNITPEPAILGFLLDRSVHGYDLYKQVNGHLGVVWRVSLSQLYAIVKTFEMRGWIVSRVRTQNARPAQKLLEVTPAGREAFAEWLDQPAHGLRELRVDFFLRLHFARSAGSKVAQRLVNRQIAACNRELKSIRTNRALVGKEEEDLGQLAHDFRIHQLISITRWLEGHRKELCTPRHADSAEPKKRTAQRSALRRSIPKTALKEK